MKANRNLLIYNTIKVVKNLYPVYNPPYLDLDVYFPEHKILEDNWELIRDEIFTIIETSKELPKFHEIDKGQGFISNNDGKAWNIFVVKLYDMWHKSNAKKCPKTVELLKSMKNVKTANFSILAPGKHIPAHFGPYKGILRYQLALEVPEGECMLFVDDKEYRWTEGQSVLFDDTYKHEVINNTNQRRIALLLDIKRQDFNVFTRIVDSIYFRLIQLGIILSGGIKRAKVH